MDEIKKLEDKVKALTLDNSKTAATLKVQTSLVAELRAQIEEAKHDEKKMQE